MKPLTAENTKNKTTPKICKITVLIFIHSKNLQTIRKLIAYEDFQDYSTVLSGAEERGVDGPSLDRSYFSRLQPISFLFFNPSSSHVG